jgi:hypothetical protein
MKNVCCFVILFVFFVSGKLSAQSQQELNSYNKERLTIQKKGMAVLNIWSLGNIAVGTAGVFTTEGATQQFHSMNIIWNGINVALAAPAYFAAKKGKFELTLRQSYKEQQKAEKTFLINAGLDIGYIIGGLYLTEKAKDNTEKWRHDLNLGYGNSFMLQGGFLFLLDVTMYAVHNSHRTKKLDRFLDNVTIGYNGVGIQQRF